MDWKQELMKRLDTLADKLGTTGQYLWHVLVKQGIAEGIGDAIAALLCLVAAILVYKLAYKRFVRVIKAEENYCDPGWYCGAIASAIVCIGLTISIGVNVYSAVLELINPEYFALHQVLQTLGK